MFRFRPGMHERAKFYSAPSQKGQYVLEYMQWTSYANIIAIPCLAAYVRNNCRNCKNPAPLAVKAEPRACNSLAAAENACRSLYKGSLSKYPEKMASRPSRKRSLGSHRFYARTLQGHQEMYRDRGGDRSSSEAAISGAAKDGEENRRGRPHGMLATTINALPSPTS